ncbi:homeodomain-like protein [Tanacetum coccineum]
MDAAIRNQGASIKALEIQIGQISMVLEERGSGNLPCSTETNPRDHVKSVSIIIKTDTTPIRRIGPSRYAVSGLQNSKLFFIPSQATIPFLSRLYDDFYDEEKGWIGKLAPTKLIVKLVDKTVKRPKGITENVLVGIDNFFFLVDFIVLDMPEDIKTPLILGRPFLSTTHAKIDVFKRKITLRVGNDKVVFKGDKPTSNVIKKVYALRLRESMKLDLEAMPMREALILNRSLDPLYGDYIKLNDLNEQLELRRNQVDDLEPTIEEGEVVDEPMMDIVKTRCDNEIIDRLDDFYNSIMKDKVEYKGNNLVGAFMNVPIFVGNFSVVADFVVMEKMDSYRDEEIGDAIVGGPFCREACMRARRFDGMITIYKENDSVTYQMARSHPRFKHLN